MPDNDRIVRRKFDIIKVLDAVMRKRFQCTSLTVYVRCIRMYFESTPQPFITRNEVEDLIVSLFHGQDVPDMQQLAKELSGEFVDLFPETTEFYNPRKLHHLCRCRIRDILTSSGCLPDSVFFLAEELQITRTMKQYILCEFS